MDVVGETWRPVLGYEGAYEVSSHGRVRSQDRTQRYLQGAADVVRFHRGRMLRGTTDEHGYQVHHLIVDGRRRAVRAHVLVAEAFLGPKPIGALVRHLDDDPSNNHFSNLAYGTQVDNMQDAIRNGRNSRLLRDRCPRGHLLQPPNLRAALAARGHRWCLACDRAVANVRAAAKRGEHIDLQVRSDWHYAQITKESEIKEIKV